jgi:uncharacterized membrane protein
MVPMFKRIAAMIKPLIKPLLAAGLVFTLVFGQAHEALAARSGGRMGGGSFRGSSRSYRAPMRTNGGGNYATGGGFGFFPGFMPFYGFGLGGGGMFSLLITIAIAGYLFQTFRNTFGSDGLEGNSDANPTISIAKVQVGLMAQARSLQLDLDRIAFNADTNTDAGRAHVLQEVSLALLRHPEYWAYGSATTERPKLNTAEGIFNRLALAERSKFTEETLSNLNGQMKKPSLAGAGSKEKLTVPQTPSELLALNESSHSEYIVVTLLVGTAAKLQFPKINNDEDMKQVLRQIGSLSADNLLAIEVIWAPQADDDNLSADDIMTNYPDMRLV